MKIVVIGGSGLIGKKLVAYLNALGHTAVPASPSTGVNAVTGEGLDAAMKGTDVVVDVSNAPSFADNDALTFFESSGRNLMAAEKAAGVRHHVALGVVGTDRMLGSGYFRAKLAQEVLITNSGIPYTIVRATQFYEFLGAIAQGSTGADGIRLPSAKLQPIAADDVARLLAKIALAKPVNGMIEIAGPEKIGLDTLVRRWLAAQGASQRVTTDEQAGYFGAKIDDRSLTADDGATLGSIRLEDWLTKSRG